jgi:hypothetical protein
MEANRDTVRGLETILEELDARYEFNENGRLTHLRGEGILPRFVLGRAAEGCVWRFSTSVAIAQVNAVSRLAGKEPGFPIAGESPALRPERLVMIERLLANGGADLEARHEVLSRRGIDVAELWTID